MKLNEVCSIIFNAFMTTKEVYLDKIQGNYDTPYINKMWVK
jgi:hypothetical protein